MDLIITWVVFVWLVAALVYPIRKERSAHAEAAHRGGKPPPRTRAARMFTTYTGLEWGLVIAAVGFLISAISGTAEALG